MLYTAKVVTALILAVLIVVSIKFEEAFLDWAHLISSFLDLNATGIIWETYLSAYSFIRCFLFSFSLLESFDERHRIPITLFNFLRFTTHRLAKSEKSFFIILSICTLLIYLIRQSHR